MGFSKQNYLLLIISFFTTLVAAQSPVKWSFSKEKISDSEYTLVFKADIKAGWYTYSLYTEDNGPIPTSITFENQDGIELLGKAVESGDKKEGVDPLFDAFVIKYSSKKAFIIKQKIKVKDASKPTSGYLTYMTCDDQTCLPPKDVDFSFKFENAGGKTGAVNPAETEKKNLGDKPTSPSGELAEASKTQINAVVGIQNPTQSSPSTGLYNPVKWTFKYEQLDARTYKLIYSGKAEDGWAIYSQKSSEDGPIPTSITFEEKEGLVKIISSEEKGHKKEGVDPYFNAYVIKYLSDQPFIIEQTIEVSDASKPIKGYLSFMACNDQTCTAPTDVDFYFALDGSQPIVDAGSTAAIGPSIEGGKLDQRIPKLYDSFKSAVGQCGAVLKSATGSGLFWTFLFGFGGGLLALLTPCVFPMIPITVSYFTKDTKRKGWVNGLIYGLSIIGIYVILGLLVTVFFGAEALNRLSTNWIANTLFFVIFVLFAFSFFGFYELTLPSSWTTNTDKMADKGGFVGIFFMAFTLSLVSFSCTGPIVGTALVQAATKGAVVGPFTVMLGFSTALALPFGLFAAFPAWLNSLPRSGSWMTSVKVVLGFLELALAFKFLSVADMTNHWGIFRYEIFMGIWVLVFAAITFYLFGFIKFPHDSPIKKFSKTRIGFGLLAAISTIYLITGFFVNDKTSEYNSLKLMSGLAPPANYNFFLPGKPLDSALAAKYTSYTKCAQGIDCFKDYYEGLAYAKETGKPLLLDFTGYGCVNCRKTEEHIWVDDRVRKILNEDVILVSLYGDDDNPTGEQYKGVRSKYTNERIRNVGKLWADFQMANFENNAQPLYVMVTPDQEVITNPRPYQDGIKEYLTFLECGLGSFSDKSLSKE